MSNNFSSHLKRLASGLAVILKNNIGVAIDDFLNYSSKFKCYR